MSKDLNEKIITLALAINPDLSRFAEADVPEGAGPDPVDTPDGEAVLLAQTDTTPALWGIEDNEGGILAGPIGYRPRPGYAALYDLLDCAFEHVPDDYIQMMVWRV